MGRTETDFIISNIGENVCFRGDQLTIQESEVLQGRSYGDQVRGSNDRGRSIRAGYARGPDSAEGPTGD